MTTASDSVEGACGQGRCEEDSALEDEEVVPCIPRRTLGVEHDRFRAAALFASIARIVEIMSDLDAGFMRCGRFRTVGTVTDGHALGVECRRVELDRARK